MNPELLPVGEYIRVRYNGRYLTAPNQKRSNLQRLRQLPVQRRCLLLLASPLFGYGVRQYMEELGDAIELVCIEYEESLYPLMTSSMSEVSNSDCIMINHPDQCNSILKLIQEKDISHVILQALSGGAHLHRDKYQQTLISCQQAILQKKRNNLTQRFFIRRWIKNLMHNMLIPPQWDALSVDRPVFLLGAGPSAEEWLPFLLQHRQRFFLLVVDSILPALADLSLLPDLIVSQDAQIVNCLDLLPYHWRDIPFFCDLTVHPTITRKSRAACFLSCFADIRLIQDLQALFPTIPSLGSVGITAYYLIRQYYKGLIFFAGMDMHYIPGKSHARHCASHRYMIKRSGRLQHGRETITHYQRNMVHQQDKNGRSCSTDVVLLSYAQTFSQLLARDSKVFDLGSTGLELGARRISRDEIWELTQDVEPAIITPYHAGKREASGSSTGGEEKASQLLQQELQKLEQFLRSEQDEDRDAPDYLTMDRTGALDAQTHARISAGDYLSYGKRQLM